MGNKINHKTNDENITNQIDARLTQCWKDHQSKKKMILFSTKGSGQSTIFQQMKLLKGHSLHIDDGTILSIRKTCKCIAIALCEIMNWLPNELKQIKELSPFCHPQNTQEMLNFCKMIKEIWQYPGSPQFRQEDKSIKRQKHFKYLDNARHFIQRIDEIMSVDYEPSNEDIIKAMFKVANEHPIETLEWTEDKCDYSLTDGPSFNRRRMSMFSGMDAIILVIDLTNYGTEVKMGTRMTSEMKAVTLDFVHMFINLRWFSKAQIFLIFNKYDKFKELNQNGLPIAEYFDDYKAEWNESKQFGTRKLILIVSYFVREIYAETPMEIVELIQHYVSTSDEFLELENYCQNAVDYLMNVFAQTNDYPNRHIHCHIATAINQEKCTKCI